MDRRDRDAVTRRLGTVRSRRQVLTNAGRGAISGIGAVLAARGFGEGLLDGGLAPVTRAQANAISIKDFEFDPPTIEIPAGTEVTWTNDGQAPHTATSDDGATFDSTRLDAGETFSHTFTTVGVFAYHCNFHPGMVGTVTVTTPTTPTTPKVYVRPNVHSLDPDGPELTAFATAVQTMKALPDTNPTSWLYQAYMHQVPADIRQAKIIEFGIQTQAEFVAFLGDRGWFSCEHHTRYFWPWHRMYLYWFERIVRHLGENPDFALPYWDYSNPSERHLPEAFRNPSSPLFANLFVQRRDPNLNNGTLPTLTPQQQNAVFDNICSTFAGPDFLSASTDLETTPHDYVHGWIGGDFANPPLPQPGIMSSPRTSAQDPVFWLHHANMDRLWSSWLAVPGHANLLDPAWLDNDENSTPGIPEAPAGVIPYTFFDELGNKVTARRTVKEVLDTLNGLGYEYEALFTPADAMCSVSIVATPIPGVEGGATPTADLQPPVELGANTPPDAIEIGLDPVTLPIALEPPQGAAGAADRGERVVLTVEGIRGRGVPGTVFEVYLNLPPGEQPDFRSPYFVGNFSLFGRQEEDEVSLLGEEAPMDEHMAMQQFNIAPNIAVLQERGEWSGDVAVTIVPYANAAASEATPTAGATPPAVSEPLATIAGVSIAME